MSNPSDLTYIDTTHNGIEILLFCFSSPNEPTNIRINKKKRNSTVICNNVVFDLTTLFARYGKYIDLDTAYLEGMHLTTYSTSEGSILRATVTHNAEAAKVALHHE